MKKVVTLGFIVALAATGWQLPAAEAGLRTKRVESTTNKHGVRNDVHAYRWGDNAGQIQRVTLRQSEVGRGLRNVGARLRTWFNPFRRKTVKGNRGQVVARTEVDGDTYYSVTTKNNVVKEARIQPEFGTVYRKEKANGSSYQRTIMSSSTAVDERVDRKFLGINLRDKVTAIIDVGRFWKRNKRFRSRGDYEMSKKLVDGAPEITFVKGDRFERTRKVTTVGMTQTRRNWRGSEFVKTWSLDGLRTKKKDRARIFSDTIAPSRFTIVRARGFASVLRPMARRTRYGGFFRRQIMHVYDNTQGFDDGTYQNRTKVETRSKTHTVYEARQGDRTKGKQRRAGIWPLGKRDIDHNWRNAKFDSPRRGPKDPKRPEAEPERTEERAPESAPGRTDVVVSP